MSNPLLDLKRHGQSVWYDYIRRDLITSGKLKRLIEADGLCGITSNPAIFQNAVTASGYYDEDIARLSPTADPVQIYETLAIDDIRAAADVLADTFRETDGGDGFVSLEVSPHLANDTDATIDEAKRLWTAVDRPNVMIKVPGTQAGLPAIRHLIGAGLNINVTLLFSVAVHARVLEAYMAGLEDLAKQGGTPARVASVASFFVSRVDTMVDEIIAERLAKSPDKGEREALQRLRGQAAIANAMLAYAQFKNVTSTPRWRALAAKGARPQRVLWASTSTKNPDYRDVKYVEGLIAADTVNTMPEATFEAFRDHGRVGATLEEGLATAADVPAGLKALGIDMDEVTSRLLRDGVGAFEAAYDGLIAGIAKKRDALVATA